MDSKFGTKHGAPDLIKRLGMCSAKRPLPPLKKVSSFEYEILETNPTTRRKIGENLIPV